MNTPSVNKILRTIKRAEKYPQQLTREELAIMDVVYYTQQRMEENLKEKEGEDVITKERKTD